MFFSAWEGDTRISTGAAMTGETVKIMTGETVKIYKAFLAMHF